MPRDDRYALTLSARRSPSARLYSAVPMLQVCPSIVMFRVGFACSLATASSSSLSASGRSVERSKSKYTSSNVSSTTGGGGVTWMVVDAFAVPPLPSSTVTVIWTGPGCCGAVHPLCRSVGFASVPLGAVHRYLSVSPSGSCASAVTVAFPPTWTEHGSQRALTVGGRLMAGGGGGGG